MIMICDVVFWLVYNNPQIKKLQINILTSETQAQIKD